MLNMVLLLCVFFGVYALLALSQNLITGWGGLLSLSHAAFYAIGAYAMAITSLAGWPLLLSVLTGVVLAGLLGLLIGLPTLRLKGDYLAIATLGFGEITRNVIINWDSLTRGPMGISGIPAPRVFGMVLAPSNKLLYAVVVWILVLVVWLVLRHLTRSRLGLALDALREDEIAARSMGIPVTRYKVAAFAIGASIAGLAGCFWAVYAQTIAPSSFDFMTSVMVLAMVVLGGLGNHLGAVAGAVLIQLVDQLPRLMGLTNVIPPQTKQIFFGLILVVMMMYRPQGILVRRRVHFSSGRGGGAGSGGGGRRLVAGGKRLTTGTASDGGKGSLADGRDSASGRQGSVTEGLGLAAGTVAEGGKGAAAGWKGPVAAVVADGGPRGGTITDICNCAADGSMGGGV